MAVCKEGQTDSSSCTSNFTAVVLVIPGIGLYIYILYIMVTKLVYPASFLPFTEPPPIIVPKEELCGLQHPLFQNAMLLCVFVFQHSMMASQAFKGFFDDIGIPVISRPVYICSTCFVINVINYLWTPYSSQTLWRLESYSLVLVFLMVHLLCWLSIACSLFAIDYLELLGIKQIYYSFNGFANPMVYKSEEQQQLFSHNRHPIFLAPTLILWAVPVMTYDRVLLAVLLPLYLGLATVIDRLDVSYISQQFNMKKLQLLAGNGN